MSSVKLSYIPFTTITTTVKLGYAVTCHTTAHNGNIANIHSQIHTVEKFLVLNTFPMLLILNTNLT